jgi:RNA polymerase sigma-70 factor (ECF subfamily)
MSSPSLLFAARWSQALQSQLRHKRIARGTAGQLPLRLLDPQSLTRHTDRLYRAAWALCGSRDDAEDLVQETFARVLARPRLLRGEEAEVAYLLRVLRNTFLTSRRDASRRPVTAATLEDVVVADPRPTLAPEQALEVGEVYGAIAGLPEHYRLALVAIDLLGLSYREAARALNVREQTITTRLFRARRLVARRFSTDTAVEPTVAAEPGPGRRANAVQDGANRAGAAAVSQRPAGRDRSGPGVAAPEVPSSEQARSWRQKSVPGVGISPRQRSLSEGIGL